MTAKEPNQRSSPPSQKTPPIPPPPPPTRLESLQAKAIKLVEAVYTAEENTKKLKEKLLENKHAWNSMRDEFLHDPDHDNDTINWALDIVDQFMPEAESD